MNHIVTEAPNPAPAVAPVMRPNTKRWHVLRELLARSPAGMTCFDAVYACHDYVLRSTVSEIQQQYGIRIDRRAIHVPNFAGGKTDCSLYWIADDQRARAAQVLGIDAEQTHTQTIH